MKGEAPPDGKAEAKAKGKANNVLKRVDDVLDKDTLTKKIKDTEEEQARANTERAALANS